MCSSDLHMMPGMDGLEASKKIRCLPGYRDVPIIALTANYGESYVAMYNDAGLNDTLYKPIEFNAFVACLRKWLPASKTSTTAVEQDIENEDSQPELQPDLEAWIPGLDKESGITYTGSLKNLEMILKVFKRTAPKMLEQIEVGSKSGDAALFRNAVHSLVSSSANIGAKALSSYARELEQAIIAGKFSEISSLYALLHEEFDKVLTGVSVHLDQADSGEKKA